MGLRHSRSSFAVAVFLASGWGQLQLQGQDRFIVQPSRRPTAAPTTAIPAAPSKSLRTQTQGTQAQGTQAQGTQTQGTQTQGPHPATNVAARKAPSWSAISPPASAEVVTAAPPLNEILELSAEQLSASMREGSSPTAAGEDSNSDKPLRWMSHQDLTTEASSLTPLASSRTNAAMPTAAMPTAAQPNADMAADMPTVGMQTPDAPGKHLASLVSSQIIAGRPAGSDASGRAVAAIDAPPGWQAIGTELSQRIAACEGLLNRKAYYSAREEADAAMLYLVRVLDLMSNRYSSEPAWYSARKAMHEAEDFSTAQRLTSDSDFLRRIILSHETPVLKDVDASELAPLAAAQHYRQYAENKLIEAAEGHPWAAEIAYALGRTYQAQADVAEDGSEQMLRWRAATLYRAARVIAPRNALAANQLAYVLLQMDRPLDAHTALVDSLNANPSIAAYENLVEASRRLGDSATGNWALQQARALRGSQPSHTAAPEVVEVDPKTFAALSPYSVGPTTPANAPTPQPQRTAAIPNSPSNY